MNTAIYKDPARKILAAHFWPFVALTFIYIVCIFIRMLKYTVPSLVGMLLTDFVLSSIMMICLDLVRIKEAGYDIDDSNILPYTWMEFLRYGNGIIVINVLQLIWVNLWSLLFVIPGIVKGLSYSQAIYIYKDASDKGLHISPLEAINKSRRLMRGHKNNLFFLHLSFVPWDIVCIFTLGIACFWVIPYRRLTLAQYYNHLIFENNQF